MHRDARNFRSRELEQLAKRLEKDHEGMFRPFGARLVLQPHVFSHLTEVGEGFELSLRPEKPKTWQHWGEFESCKEVLRKRRFNRDWRFLLSLEQAEKWARSELEQYVKELRSANHGLNVPPN